MEETEAPAPPADPIAAFLAATQGGQRPGPSLEEEAAAALKAKFSGSKTDIEEGIAAAVQLPWNVAVKAASAAWPEMGVTAKRNFLAELAKLDSDGGKRLRLSLARGLHKSDPAAAIKIVSSLCSAWKKAHGETGLPGKDRQSLFNVLIGKGKPWLLQWKWDDFKPADVPAVAFSVLSTAFQGNCPPLTQSSLVRWTGASGKIEKLPEPLVAAIRKEVGRWKSKLKEQTLAETPNAPDWLKDLLAAPSPEQNQAPAPAAHTEPAKTPEDTSDSSDAPPMEAAPQAEENASQQGRHSRRRENDRASRQQRNQPQSPRGENERAGAGGQQQQPSSRGNDPLGLLRQVEAHIQSLRNEVTHAKAQVRQREDEIRKLKTRGGGRRKKSDGDPQQQLSDPQYDTTELSRHNEQLEERVRHLQTQLDELTEQHEAVAISRQDAGADPESAVREQFKALVGLKVEELYLAFKELTAGPQNEALVDHYRELLGNIFGALGEMGIPIPEAEQQALPLRSSRSMKSWKSE